MYLLIAGKLDTAAQCLGRSGLNLLTRNHGFKGVNQVRVFHLFCFFCIIINGAAIDQFTLVVEKVDVRGPGGAES